MYSNPRRASERMPCSRMSLAPVFFATGDAPGPQLAVDPRRAVDRAGLLVDLADQLGQAPAADRVGAGRTVAPGVGTATGDAEHLAHQIGGELALVVADEGEPHGCSLAKKAVAFFKGVTRRPLCRNSPVEPGLLLLDPVFQEVVPLVVEVQRPDLEHRLGSRRGRARNLGGAGGESRP